MQRTQDMTNDMVVTNVTLIDGTGAAPATGVDIVVRDGRIEGVGEEIGVGVDLPVIDGTDKHLIPGLWETETHLTRPVTGVLDDIAVASADDIDVTLVQAHLRAYLACGFTTVVDLGGPEELLAPLRERQARGEIEGSRVLITGRQFTAVGGQPMNPDGTRWATVTKDVDDPEAARQMLLEMIERHGLDAVKANYTAGGEGAHGAGPMLNLDVLRVLVQEGHRHNLPVHVHIDAADAAVNALEVGVDNVEHMFEPHAETLERDVERVTELCVQTGAYWPFTLVLWEGLGHLGDESYLDELDLRDLVPESSMNKMLTDPASLWQLANDELREHYLERFEAGSRYLPQVLAAGVKTTMSSDAGAPPIFHGPTTSREIELTVRSGVPPMDALVAATRDSAIKLRKDDQLGTVEAGKIADMVLLDGDPLTDISSIRRIAAVIQGGSAVVTPQTTGARS
jgi:imidazolonepropionase-like amidohydrolase